ncbi:hypothetical protein KQI63_10435 [bacterium]|nr:hypothetical protein [bacterium]
MFSIRNLMTYSIVVGLSGGLEAAHARYEAQMIAEMQALEQALVDVRTLHGLLPICSN